MVLFYVCPGSFSVTEEVFGLIHSVRVEDQKPIQWLQNFTVRQNTTPDNMLSTLLGRLTF